MKTVDLIPQNGYNKYMRIERLKLKKLSNTRDLGGFPAADGKKIRSGKLIRSGRLYKIPPSTVKALEDMGVSTIVDMRIERERMEYPCVIVPGARHINLPLVCAATTGITSEKSMASTMLKESKRIKSEFGTADNYMKSVYEMILFTPESQKSLKEFLDLVRDEESTILWHCNAGKDRTGISSMLLEHLLGVDEELIIQDYCISQKYFQPAMRRAQRLGLVIAPIPLQFKRILYALMDAKPEYIISAIETIKERHGSVINYCKEALDVTDEDIKILRDKYLE